MSPLQHRINKRLQAHKRRNQSDAKYRAASFVKLALVHATRMDTPVTRAPANGLTAHYLNVAMKAVREVAS